MTPVRTLVDSAVVTVSLAACSDPQQRPVGAESRAAGELDAAASTRLIRRADLADSGAYRPSPAMAESRPLPTEDRERYASLDASPVNGVVDEPVSTFSIDVDTGSYANVRRFLSGGTLPPRGAVRVEEPINYFDYDYAAPTRGTPFSVTTTLAPTPWNASSELLRIAIQGQDVGPATARSSNLVFLVDVSGSMASPDKLGLLTSSLAMLARGLEADDRGSIVTYAGAVGTVLDGAPGNDVAPRG